MKLGKKGVIGALFIVIGVYLIFNSGAITGGVIGVKASIFSFSFILGVILGVVGVIFSVESHQQTRETEGGLEKEARRGVKIVDESTEGSEESSLGKSHRKINPKAELEKFRVYSRKHPDAVEIFDTSAIIAYNDAGVINEFVNQMGHFVKRTYIPRKVLHELNVKSDEASQSANLLTRLQKNKKMNPMRISERKPFGRKEFIRYIKSAEEYLAKTDKAKAYVLINDLADKYGTSGSDQKYVEMEESDETKIREIKRYLSPAALEKIKREYCSLDHLRTVGDFRKLRRAVEKNYKASKTDAEVVGGALYLAKHGKTAYVYHKDKDISQAIGIAQVKDRDFQRHIRVVRAA